MHQQSEKILEKYEKTNQQTNRQVYTNTKTNQQI
jgi:hypothetical protein